MVSVPWKIRLNGSFPLKTTDRKTFTHNLECTKLCVMFFPYLSSAETRYFSFSWIPGHSFHPHLGPPPSAVFASSYAVPSRGRKSKEWGFHYSGMTRDGIASARLLPRNDFFTLDIGLWTLAESQVMAPPYRAYAGMSKKVCSQ